MAKSIRADNPEEFVKLEKEVRKYIETTPYLGRRDLELEKLVLESYGGALRRAIVYLTEPDLKLDKIDKGWLDGLKHLGYSYGVRVVLHERYYLR